MIGIFGPLLKNEINFQWNQIPKITYRRTSWNFEIWRHVLWTRTEMTFTIFMEIASIKSFKSWILLLVFLHMILVVKISDSYTSIFRINWEWHPVAKITNMSPIKSTARDDEKKWKVFIIFWYATTSNFCKWFCQGMKSLNWRTFYLFIAF